MSMWDEQFSVYLSNDSNDGRLATSQSTIDIPNCFIYATYSRSTVCDVLSLVTTTSIMRNGMLKYAKPDITLSKRETQRGIPPSGLFDEGVSNLTRQELHARLTLERNIFMTKLKVRRMEHQISRNSSALKIQACVRRHLVRCRWNEIRENCLARQHLRELIRGQHHPLIVTTQKRHLRREKAKRQTSAVIVQCAFRRLVTRLMLENQLKAKVDETHNRMALRIQKARRRSQARQFTASIVLDKYMNKLSAIKNLGAFGVGLIYRTATAGVNVACTVIQRAFRRRKKRCTEERLLENKRIFNLRNRSAMCLQSLFRGYKVRRQMAKLAHYVIRLQTRVRLFTARCRVLRMRANREERIKLEEACALRIQKVFRSRLARMKVGTIRKRLLMYTHFLGATAMQCVVRGRLARLSVARIRSTLEAVRNEVDLARKAEEEEKILAEEREHNFAELNSSDIFFHAKEGNAGLVDRIFNDSRACPPHSVHDVNEDNDTILLVAAANGHLEIAQRCVWWGFNLNHRNKNEETAIMLSVKNGHESVVSFMLELPNAVSTDKYKPKTLLIKPQDTAIMTTAAARNGNTKLLKKLCDYGVIIDAKLQTNGLTALHVACELNYLDAIRLLVAQKCSISCVDDKGMTPLMKASGASCQATRILLGLSEESHILLKRLDKDSSSQVRVRDIEGKDCYTHAALNGHDEVLDMFSQLVLAVPTRKYGTEDSNDLDHSAHAVNESPFEEKYRRHIVWSQADIACMLRLIELENLICIRWLIDEGFSANATLDETGKSLAMVASEYGRIDVLNLLLQRGANMSIPDVKGRSVMHYAAMSKNKIVEYLLEHPLASKCKISSSLLALADNDGDTPIHISGQFGTLLPRNVLSDEQWIIALKVVNANSMTPLMEACKHQQYVLVMRFVEFGADMTALDASGRNCLWHFLYPRETLHMDDHVYGKAALLLLYGGCSLYQHVEVDINNPVPLLESVNAGDFAVLSLDGAALEELREVFTKDLLTLWWLVRSAIIYEKGSNYALRALLNKATLEALSGPFFDGYSLQGWACILHNPMALDLLLQKSPVDREVDKEGNSALHIAARYNYVELIRIQVERGKGQLDIDARNKAGFTAAMVGAKYCSVESVRLLHKRYGASARDALDGYYWAWLLALAMKEVRNMRYKSLGHVREI